MKTLILTLFLLAPAILPAQEQPTHSLSLTGNTVFGKMLSEKGSNFWYPSIEYNYAFSSKVKAGGGVGFGRGGFMIKNDFSSLESRLDSRLGDAPIYESYNNAFFTLADGTEIKDALYRSNNSMINIHGDIKYCILPLFYIGAEFGYNHYFFNDYRDVYGSYFPNNPMYTYEGKFNKHQNLLGLYGKILFGYKTDWSKKVNLFVDAGVQFQGMRYIEMDTFTHNCDFNKLGLFPAVNLTVGCEIGL